MLNDALSHVRFVTVYAIDIHISQMRVAMGKFAAMLVADVPGLRGLRMVFKYQSEEPIHLPPISTKLSGLHLSGAGQGFGMTRGMYGSVLNQLVRYQVAMYSYGAVMTGKVPWWPWKCFGLVDPEIAIQEARRQLSKEGADAAVERASEIAGLEEWHYDASKAVFIPC